MWKVDPERGGPMMSQRCAGRAAPSSWNRSSRNSSGTCRTPSKSSERPNETASKVNFDLRAGSTARQELENICHGSYSRLALHNRSTALDGRVGRRTSVFHLITLTYTAFMI